MTEDISELQELIGLSAEPSEIVQVLYGKSLAPDDLINTELTKEEAIVYAMFESLNDNDDEECSLSSSVLRAFTRSAKLNLISKDRQGRKEVVMASRGDDEDRGRMRKVVDFITGGGPGE